MGYWEVDVGFCEGIDVRISSEEVNGCAFGHGGGQPLIWKESVPIWAMQHGACCVSSKVNVAVLITRRSAGLGVWIKVQYFEQNLLRMRKERDSAFHIALSIEEK